jgi:hypothetical protein
VDLRPQRRADRQRQGIVEETAGVREGGERRGA